MKPTIHKRKDIRGRKIVGYSATIGPVTTDATDQTRASELCETAVSAALARLAQGTKIGQWNGHTYVVSPETYGWQYWIDAFGRQDYGVSVQGYTRDQTEDSAIAHLAQSDWNEETDDHAMLASLPRSKRADMATWIGFQRSYIRIKAANDLPENDRHLAACEMGNLYAREHFGAYR